MCLHFCCNIVKRQKKCQKCQKYISVIRRATYDIYFNVFTRGSVFKKGVLTTVWPIIISFLFSVQS